MEFCSGQYCRTNNYNYHWQKNYCNTYYFYLLFFVQFITLRFFMRNLNACFVIWFYTFVTYTMPYFQRITYIITFIFIKSLRMFFCYFSSMLIANIFSAANEISNCLVASKVRGILAILLLTKRRRTYVVDNVRIHEAKDLSLFL